MYIKIWFLFALYINGRDLLLSLPADVEYITFRNLWWNMTPELTLKKLFFALKFNIVMSISWRCSSWFFYPFYCSRVLFSFFFSLSFTFLWYSFYYFFLSLISNFILFYGFTFYYYSFFPFSFGLMSSYHLFFWTGAHFGLYFSTWRPLRLLFWADVIFILFSFSCRPFEALFRRWRTLSF